MNKLKKQQTGQLLLYFPGQTMFPLLQDLAVRKKHLKKKWHRKKKQTKAEISIQGYQGPDKMKHVLCNGMTKGYGII